MHPKDPIVALGFIDWLSVHHREQFPDHAFYVYDQRRFISVHADGHEEDMHNGFDVRDDVGRMLMKHIDDIAPDVTRVYLSQDGNILSVSRDKSLDITRCMYYVPLSEVQKPSSVKTVLRSELRELNRLGSNTDLVSYVPSGEETPRKVVFKYLCNSIYRAGLWDEWNMWCRLPPHPNIVPFDRLVVDEVNGSVVGFTNVYIPNDTLQSLPDTIKLKWVKQLFSVVDDLNLKYGIHHQDILTRNLIVDPSTDNLMIFDFSISARYGQVDDETGRPFAGPYHPETHADIDLAVCAVYELITRDTKHRYWRGNLTEPQEMELWPPHPDVKLDHPLSEFRSVVSAWLKKRREGVQISLYTEAPEHIDWPPMNRPPETDVNFAPVRTQYMDLPVFTEITWEQDRRKMKPGSKIVSWQRPPQSKLEAGTYVLATGEVVKEHDTEEAGRLTEDEVEKHHDSVPDE